ncbi:DUF4440 domain-containing protein [Primorskyibacter sp. S87]|uniref:DUF4440 domain-containing protein n=1 Tax=Primorskyibacter sp. S87 TaxID=3415126 RepID=UPI003C7C4902
MERKIKPLPDLSFFRELETRVWQALVAGDPQADGSMLTSDFLGVYPSGFSDRAGHMAALENGPAMQSYALDRERLVPLSNDHVILCYRARYVPAGEEAEKIMYISSLWVRAEGGWLNSFSQDTPAA